MSARDEILAHPGVLATADAEIAILLGVHRIEVLREATAVTAAERLVDATGQPDDVGYNQAIGDVVAALNRAAYGERSDAARDFFQPGRTYAEPGDTTDWRFRCDTITTHPKDGERTALGWRRFQGEWTACAYGEDDWEIHRLTGVTEAGETA